MKKLAWSEIAMKGEWLHFAVRTWAAGGGGGGSHWHDFAELMLIERGSLQHKVNGSVVEMRKGAIALIRPQDVHTMKAGEKGVTFCNVAFPAEALRHIARTCFSGRLGFWGWREKLPLHLQLGDEAFSRVLFAAKSIAGQRKGRFFCERFLMNIIFELGQHLGIDGGETRAVVVPPRWLALLHEAMLAPANARAGVKRLFKLSGRCREHVNRSFKAAYGMSPTDFVNETRLFIAEGLLLSGEMKIPDIASSCGMKNLSHFHKLFKARYGMSPHHFRIGRRSAVI